MKNHKYRKNGISPLKYAIIGRKKNGYFVDEIAARE
jgi:hypothetical protein